LIKKKENIFTVQDPRNEKNTGRNNYLKKKKKADKKKKVKIIPLLAHAQPIHLCFFLADMRSAQGSLLLPSQPRNRRRPAHHHN
jgi:hypothetical protein